MGKDIILECVVTCIIYIYIYINLYIIGLEVLAPCQLGVWCAGGYIRALCASKANRDE